MKAAVLDLLSGTCKTLAITALLTFPAWGMLWALSH
jgi:hypothetical protein